jgi:hypothetical protein
MATATTEKTPAAELVELAVPVVPEVEETDDELVDKERVFTLVEHHAAVYGGYTEMARRVQVVPVESLRIKARVEKANGVIFCTYAEAEALVAKANSYAEKNQKLAGTFSSKVIGEARVYVPKREAVA